MSDLAASLDALEPLSNARVSGVDIMMKKLDEEDRAAVHSALTDWDTERKCYRVSQRRLSDTLVAAGYDEVTPTSISNWRNRWRKANPQ